MSVDYTRTTGGETPEESESSTFAPAPIWDRRKGKGSGRAFFEQNADRDTTMDREVRTDTGSTAVGAAAGMAGGTVMGEEAVRETAMSPNGDDAPFIATTGQRTVVRRERSMAPAAVGVGLVALAALAAAGWYATRPADKTLTPGGPTSTAIAAIPPVAAGGANTTQMAANTPTADNAGAATPRVTTTTTHHTVTTSTRSSTPVVRSRSTSTAVSPARSAPSAATSGVNTGANAPVNTPPLNSVGVVPSAPVTATPPPAAITSQPVSPMPSPTPTPAPSTTAPATPDVTPAPTTATPAPTPTPPQ